MGGKKKIIKKITTVGNVILIRHDKAKDMSSGGILLPEDAKIDTATAIILVMPEKMKENPHDHPYKEGDRIVYDIRRRMPYNSDPKDKHYLIYADAILAVEEEEEIEDATPEENVDADRSDSN